jgi:hypothetical protein
MGGKKKAAGGDQVYPASHHATKLSLPTATPEEKLCADVWLFIDSKMRLALQVHKHDLRSCEIFTKNTNDRKSDQNVLA